MPAHDNNTKPGNKPTQNLLQCVTQFGQAKLQRFTPDPTGTLRAWDAADLYLLDTLAESGLPTALSNVLLINDQFGALVTFLSSTASTATTIHSINDSCIGRRATELNRAENDCTQGLSLKAGFDSDTVESEPGTHVDLVLMKIPKSIALLTDQLHQLRKRVHPETIMLASGMARHLVPNVRSAFETIIGPTTSSRAVRKARVLRAHLAARPDLPDNPYPMYITVDALAKPLLQLSAVFSQKRLDAGSELLIRHLPPIKPGATVIDLGCGNGVLGLVAMKQQTSANVIFIDESSAAIESARSNAARLFPEQPALFLNQDSLDPLPETPADLILCNPPFHSQHNLVLETAERMFQQSRKALSPGGALVIVGNRHLDYIKRLERLFGNHRVIAQNNKFQVIAARRR